MSVQQMNRFKQWMLETQPQLIVSVSSGKDSTDAYLEALRFGLKFRAVMADTGNENDIALDYAQRLGERTGGPTVEFVRADFSERIAKKRIYVRDKWPEKGVPSEVVERALTYLHPTGNPFLDLCLWKARFPSRKAQFCTEELKAIPIAEQIILPALKNGPVVQWHGVRADESLPRSKLPRAQWDDDTGAIIWRPILFRNVEQVFASHRRANLEPNPLYSMGMSRVGCFPCINCQKDELRQIALRFPEHIERIREWEWLVAQVSKRYSATFFAAVTDDADAASGPVSHLTHGIERVVEWSKTTRGGVQYDLLSFAQDPNVCSSKYGLCE